MLLQKKTESNSQYKGMSEQTQVNLQVASANNKGLRKSGLKEVIQLIKNTIQTSTKH